MGYWGRISEIFKQFKRSEGGVVAVLVAFLMVLLIVFAGMAIDFGLAFNTRRAVNQSLDAAVLAVANNLATTTLSEDDVQTMVEEYFAANLALSEGSDTVVATPVVNYTVGADFISASATAELNNSFSPLLNILTRSDDDSLDKITVATSSTARFPRNDVEVAVVVDVTGSMSSDIDTLKTASTRLLDALLPEGTNQAKSKIRMSFVPYNEGVKLANDLAEQATFTISESGCVHERITDQAATDVAHDFEDDEGNTDYIGAGFEDCPADAEVVSLTADRNKILSVISDLSADDGTAGHIGITWGWYTISPKWADFWPSGSEPLAYETENLRKYAVFMTDGDFNRYHRDRDDYEDVEDARKELIDDKIDEGTWTPGPNPDGSNKFTRQEHEDLAEFVDWDEESSSGPKGTSSMRAKAVCSNMKSQNITIYSIYFGTSNRERRVMEDCASNDDTFYLATNESALILAFEKIANDIKDIYLSQ
ncbi:hypothetical protein PsAD2_01596 [Pseudovibrio axinellae]|uniref:Putative Flp pilus-assembly TadG-like N-terminal domain-containing protein n=2 Tax=Pseudovibrio axinellae TaxID=989403 RepID=A0A161V5J8_9HYPH|nr:hypothetical protein PsAD2_01596 [Pseudovibrio axinellae]SEQ24997.1 Flp pilus assembly protein TadG [Pseudovibrio axinellae]